MSSLRTEVTEITTGLAMLGYQDLSRALEVRPRHITHVTESSFVRIEEARQSGTFSRDFEVAWENGHAFARSPLGLRGRPPWTLEWKGPHKPASKGIETIPADLRIDHVYLISCKYGSRILHNSGPVPLFDHCLAPQGPVPRSNWFETVCPESFRAVWSSIYQQAGVPAIVTPSTATAAHRTLIDAFLAHSPIDTSSAEYRAFVDNASQLTAARWRMNLRGERSRSELLWRMLRMQAAPYFVLGARSDHSPLRYRVCTPWDFNQRFSLRDLQIVAGARGQPSVDWSADVVDNERRHFALNGHVEVRWSHGKLNGSPEAKLYLDSEPDDVPGYDVI